MLKRITFALLALAFVVQSACCAVLPYHLSLKDGTTVTLQMVEDNQTNVDVDLLLGLAAFEGAFDEATDFELQTHFGPDRDIRNYYEKLFNEDDVPPFRTGQMIWIRALVEDRLVGWMTLLPRFQGPDSVYISTLVVDPNYQSLGIGRGFIESIATHWFPESTEIDVVVRRINYQALPFYHRLGFEPAPDIESPYLGDPTRCLFLRLKVPCRIEQSA